MADLFKDVKVGDTVYRPEIITSMDGWARKTLARFWYPMKVVRVTSKQFVVQGAVRFGGIETQSRCHKSDGRLIGESGAVFKEGQENLGFPYDRLGKVTDQLEEIKAAYAKTKKLSNMRLLGHNINTDFTDWTDEEIDAVIDILSRHQCEKK